jgi:hypothetical protein
MSGWVYEDEVETTPIVEEFTIQEIIAALKIAGFMLETDIVSASHAFRDSIVFLIDPDSRK